MLINGISQEKLRKLLYWGNGQCSSGIFELDVVGPGQKSVVRFLREKRSKLWQMIAAGESNK